MPTIKNYRPKVAIAGPAQSAAPTAASFGAAKARGIQQLGQGVEQSGEMLFKIAERREQSDLNSKFSKLHAEKEVELKNTLENSDPGDKTIVDKFNKGLQKEFEAISEGIATPSGRALFERTKANYTATFGKSAILGQAQLASDKSVEDVATSSNARAKSVEVNPLAFDDMRAETEAQIKDFVESGQISRELGRKMLTNETKALGRATLRGFMFQSAAGPAMAEKAMQTSQFGGMYSAKERKSIQLEVRQAENAWFTEDQRRKSLKKEAIAARDEKTMNGFVIDMYSANGLSAKKVLESSINHTNKEHFLGAIKRLSSAKFVRDPSRFNDIYLKIHAAANDPNLKYTHDMLIEEVEKGGVDKADIKTLEDLILQVNSPEGKVRASAKRDILQLGKALTKSNELTGFIDLDGDMLRSQYNHVIEKRMLDAINSGEDMDVLLDPTSDKWLGKEVKRFTKTGLQLMDQQLERMQKMVDEANKKVEVEKQLEAQENKAPAQDQLLTPGKRLSPDGKTVLREDGESMESWVKRQTKHEENL